MRELSEARKRSARVTKPLEGQVRSNSDVLQKFYDIHRFKIRAMMVQNPVEKY